jgi:copper transport protein
LLGATGLVVSWIATRLPTATVRARQVTGAIGVALAIALAVTWSAADHSGTGDQVAVALPADVAHLLAMAAWVGGLTLLAVAVLSVHAASLPEDDRAGIVRRFSPVAFSSVAVLAVTGSYQGWRQVRTLDALTGTAYGRLLLIKVAGFILLIALGAYARRRLASSEPDLKSLRRSVGAEFGIAVCILGVTSLLVESQPARTVTSAPVSVSAPFDAGAANGGGGTVKVVIDPAKVGVDTVQIYVLGAGGRQESVLEVDASLALPSQQIGPLTVKLDNAGPGHYIGSNVPIPNAGGWQVIVTVRTKDTGLATVILTVQVK